jgi:ribonuclease P protein component
MAKARNTIPNKAFRLKKRSDFLRLQHKGVKQVMADFILQACPCPDELPDSRFGYTASKKIGNAVARNRAKRRMRALATLNTSVMRTHTDYVLIARKSILYAPFNKLVADMAAALLAVHKKLDKKPQTHLKSPSDRSSLANIKGE